MSDGFFAVALGFGCHTATSYENKVGDRPRSFGDRRQVDDFVSGGAVAGFEVKGFGSVEAATKCDKGDFHL